MKKSNELLALVLMAVALVFASCSKDNNDPAVPSQQEIETKIIGKWKRTITDGKEVLTNRRDVFTFAQAGSGTHSMSSSKPNKDVLVWVNKEETAYSIVNNKLCIKEIATFNISIDKIEENQMLWTLESVSSNGVDVKDDNKAIYTKVTTDYSQDIIGMWEGVELTGDETYGNANARIEYRADGTYTYFKKYADIWCPSENVDNEYNVDGDWLATRWRPEKGSDYNYEWWDIDKIKNGTMNWSALREKENGERYTTTFTWKKVDSPTEEQYKAMILGEWKVVEGINYEFKDGKLVDSTPASLGSYYIIYTFNPDNTFSMIRFGVDGTKSMESYGHYKLQGSVVSFIYEKMFFRGEPLDVSELAYGTEAMGISAIDKENLTLVEYMKFEDDYDECDHLLMYMKMQRQ